MLTLGGKRIVRVSHLFSLPILLRTLWAPWRRIISYPGAGLDAKLRAVGDNMVSRVIGFTVRVLVLITACLIVLLTSVLQLIFVILWPLLPVAIIAFIIKGVIG